MAVKKLIQVGDPVLRKHNKPIKDFDSPQLKKLIKDLKDTMYAANLVGIAAPQIGKNYLVFITHARNTSSRNLGKEDGCRVYVNPVIKNISKVTACIYEGCGSIAEGKIFGPVIRPKEITVEAYNELGSKFLLTCNGLLATIIQHEYDHLQGVEFMQKVSDYDKIMSQYFYRKAVRNSKNQKEAIKIKKIVYKEF